MQTIDYVINSLETLVNIPSPTGYTHNAIAFVEKEAQAMGYETEHLKKGGLIITVPGKTPAITGLSAHVDTLGAMVRSLNSDGTLNLMSVGGFTMESIEASYCKIHTRTGKVYEGTILSKSPAVHSYDDARTLDRTERNMRVRVDEIADSVSDLQALEIEVGDFISFDPGFRYLENGYVKSRHLDDKASVAVLLGLLKDIKESGKTPEKTLKLLISNYEEVGHGASYVPEGMDEMLAVDMGVVGDDLAGDERKVSICAKDSSGPYDYDMTNRLIALAKENGIGYAVDVFPHYGSDASAALKGGNNIRAALIGQGVNASHSMERTHRDGLLNTLKLVEAYVL